MHPKYIITSIFLLLILDFAYASGGSFELFVLYFVFMPISITIILGSWSYWYSKNSIMKDHKIFNILNSFISPGISCTVGFLLINIVTVISGCHHYSGYCSPTGGSIGIFILLLLLTLPSILYFFLGKRIWGYQSKIYLRLLDIIFVIVPVFVTVLCVSNEQLFTKFNGLSSWVYFTILLFPFILHFHKYLYLFIRRKMGK